MGLVAALLLSTLALAPAASAEVLPQPVLIGTIDPDSPRLQWNPVIGATKYKVEMSANADYSSPYYSVTTDNLQATPFKDAPVGTTYFRVRAVDSTNTIGTPAEDTFVRTLQQVVDGIDGSPTVAPANGSTVPYPSPVVLRWPWVARAFNYTVEVDDNSGFTTPDRYTNIPGTSLALQTTPAFGTTQYWRVKGISDTGAETSWSGPWSFVQDWLTASAVPTGLTPANDPAGTAPLNDVHLSWDPVVGAEKYQVQVSLSSDFNDLSRSIFDGTVVSAGWSPQPALAAASYYWRVRAVAFGDRRLTNGWSATRQFRRAWGPEEDNPAPPVSPSDKSALAYPVPKSTSSSGVVARDDFRLEWEPVRRAGAYVVQISTNRNFPAPPPTGTQTITCTTYRTILTANRLGSGTENKPFNVRNVPANTNTLVNSLSCDAIDPVTTSPTTGLVSGSTYYWRVMAVDTSADARRANDPNIVMTPWSSDQEDPVNPPSFQLDRDAHTGATAGPGVSLVSPADGVTVPDAPELVWAPVSGKSLYRVQTALDPTFTNMQSIQYTTSTRLVPAGSMQDNDTSGSYYWRVQACNGPGNCDPTTEVRRFSKRNEIIALHPVDVTNDQVRFSWDTLSETPGSAGVVRDYRIDISTDPSFTQPSALVDSDFVDVPFYSSPAKTFGVGQYYWRVVPIDDFGRELATKPNDLNDPDTTWQFAVTTQALTPGTPPAGLPIDVSSASPTLTWSPAKAVSGYQVEIYKGANLSGTIEQASGTVSAAAYTPATKRFTPGVYSWRVRKIGPGGAVGSWNTDTMGTPPTFTIGTSVPAGLSPTDGAVVDPDERLLRWDPVRGAVSYKVKLTGSNLNETTTTAYTWQAPVGVLTAGPTYSWTVAAVNAAGETLGETAARTFTVRTIPGLATATTANASGTTVTFAWGSPANDGGAAISGYILRYRPSGGAWTELGRAADVRSVAISALTQSTKYEAQVAAVNQIGQGFWTPLVSATTATTPSAPGSLRVTPGVGSLAISWSRPADGGSPITGYVVRYTPVGGGTTIVNTAALSTTLTRLTPGVAYALEVAAVNDVGAGPFATAVQGTPQSPTTAPSPTPTTGSPGSAVGTTLSISGGKTVMFGGTAALSGTLKSSSGAAVGSKSVTVQSRPVGSAAWDTVASTTTSSSGGWSVNVKPSANREYRAVFAASAPHQASTSATVKVLVAPQVTIKLSAKKVKLGKKVTFSGAVKPDHKATKVQLQRLQGKKWVTKASVRTTSTSTYRFTWKTDSKTAFYWRVLIPGHGDHAKSYSRARRLTVL
jgi:hypothetical protein